MSYLDVFNHQLFLLRQSPEKDEAEEPLRLSFRDIMTGKGEGPLWFNYPLEYMNAAALGLCAALAQVLFEPEDMKGLAELLAAPIEPDEFDARAAALLEAFSIDGPIRFMGWPGPPPARDRKGRLAGADPFSAMLLTTKKGDKEFLNRPDGAWCVRLDQIPLLLFSRSTFYEKSAGRGYLTGTSGDMEIRTFVVDGASLRRTIVLNVLARERQETPAASPYDDWFWSAPPPEREVPRDAISFRSALFWMVARFFIDIGELAEPRRCVVTGDLLPAGERAGMAMVTASTGVGFGAKIPGPNGVDVRSSFFTHPNGPYLEGLSRKDVPYRRHLTVLQSSGLVGQMAGLFFNTDDGTERRKHFVAPVVDQVNVLRLNGHSARRSLAHLHLYCFGFHMLSSKANVHGGYESERFLYPLLLAGRHVAGLIYHCAHVANGIDGALGAALQICTLLGVGAEKDEATGRISYRIIDRPGDLGLLSEATRMLWSATAGELRELLRKIGEAVGALDDDASEDDERDRIEELRPQWQAEWEDAIALHAERIFYETFDDYVSSPVSMAAAHHARRFFYGALTNIARGIITRRQQAHQSEEAAQ